MWYGLILPMHMGPSPTNSKFFYIPVCIHALVAKYFEDIKMCCTHQDFMTD